mmetsp:Transcript_15694/g.42565  ORF Transcript_15694/g.42565 Transcript_15694/m.42565 type:complete len:203 (+) Transcript_15694:2950-3558(+)
MAYPPNTTILFLPYSVTAACSRGEGAVPSQLGLYQVKVAMSRKWTSLRRLRSALRPPNTTSRLFSGSYKAQWLYLGCGLSPFVGCRCHSMRSRVIQNRSLEVVPSLATWPPKMMSMLSTCVSVCPLLIQQRLSSIMSPCSVLCTWPTSTLHLYSKYDPTGVPIGFSRSISSNLSLSSSSRKNCSSLDRPLSTCALYRSSRLL